MTQIWVVLTALLVTLASFLIALRFRHRNQRYTRKTLHPPTIRLCLRQLGKPTIKRYRKPGWVITEVLRLIAITRGQVGCRTIAMIFNARFEFRGESVSKSFVAQLRKNNHYAILQLRKQLRKPPKLCKSNQIWALDWTNVSIKAETRKMLGVIDHGSRKLLALELADRSASNVIQTLRNLIDNFGKPKTL
jgi:putative transposase